MLSEENLAKFQAPKAQTPVIEAYTPISDLEAVLEPVQTNERFLKKLAQSKRMVLKKARSLKRFSYGVGAMALLLCVGSFVTAMTMKHQA
jgi:hypothetical protein